MPGDVPDLSLKRDQRTTDVAHRQPRAAGVQLESAQPLATVKA